MGLVDWLVIAKFSQAYYIFPALMVIFVVWILFKFFQNYIFPASNLNEKLNNLSDYLEKLNNYELDKDSLDSKFEQNSALKTAWLNYKKTFHDIKETIDGEDVLVESRATVPSELFFSENTIVDTPLKVEFYKHLPGIVTGVGIIATFAGLLFGLLAFDPAGDPAKVQDSLALLLRGVGEAFLASGIAIATAMFITWREKSWLRKSYENLQRLTTTIDDKFTFDVSGEEYLAKILESSEKNETNARQLKDSLVNDLKAMMTNLVEENKKNQLAFAAQLSESYTHTSQAMVNQIGQSITDTLQAPLDKIASSVQQVSGDQGSAVQSLMTDVLTAFMTKLETTFGSQMTGMNDMMTQSVTAMREMQSGFSQLLVEMRTNSEASNKALESQIASMLDNIQQKQNEMSNQMNVMVDQLTAGAAKIGEQGQNTIDQLNAKVTELISGLGGSMSELLESVAKQRADQDRFIADNQQKLHAQSSELLNDLGGSVTELIKQTQNAIEDYKANLKKLSDLTTHSIDGMNAGAQKMLTASEQFNLAGNSLITVTDKTSQLISQVNTTSTNLTSASNTLIELTRDYKNSQQTMNFAINTLEELIQQAQSEAGMNRQMLDDMRQMTSALNQVKSELQSYLTQISDVLVISFDSFGSSVETSLNHALGAFDNTLDQAVKRLATGVEGLGNVVEDIEDIVQKNSR